MSSEKSLKFSEGMCEFEYQNTLYLTASDVVITIYYTDKAREINIIANRNGTIIDLIDTDCLEEAKAIALEIAEEYITGLE